MIKFGTDGWRAIIAREFTVENVARVAEATGRFMLNTGLNPLAIVGYDCRFGGKLFTETTARVLASMGIKVIMSKEFVSTPMLSLGVVHFKAGIGVIITASHNPPDYNGFKVKAAYGGAAIPSDIAVIETLIPDHSPANLKEFNDYVLDGFIVFEDLEEIYYQHAMERFDMNAIRSLPFDITYDAMYGAGQKVLPRLIPKAINFHCDYNPSFKGQAPEPLDKNLSEQRAYMAANLNAGLGLATDGDADRIGLFNRGGKFIDSHRILLLIIYYLHYYKGISGKVVISFSVTEKVAKLCAHFGLPVEITKIGFKYICEIMQNEEVMVGGEESGGIAMTGHIPERDGIWSGLMVMEAVAKTGKSVDELLNEIYSIVGPFEYDRLDMHITEDLKQRVLKNCKEGRYKNFDDLVIQRIDDIDGYRYFFSEDSWVMIRASGTEPLLRVYGQAPTMPDVKSLLAKVEKVLRSA